MSNETIDPKTYSLCEAVADLVWNYVADIKDGKISGPADSRELVHSCIEWAAEFEAKNKGREWDGEYMEEIDEFYLQKINAL